MKTSITTFALLALVAAGGCGQKEAGPAAKRFNERQAKLQAQRVELSRPKTIKAPRLPNGGYPVDGYGAGDAPIANRQVTDKEGK